MRKAGLYVFDWQRLLGDATHRAESLLPYPPSLPPSPRRYDLEISGND